MGIGTVLGMAVFGRRKKYVGVGKLDSFVGGYEYMVEKLGLDLMGIGESV